MTDSCSQLPSPSRSISLGINETFRLTIILGIVALEKCFRTLLTVTYALMPCKWLLDRLYSHAKVLRWTFSKRFEGPTLPKLSGDTAQLLALMDLGCESLEAETEDGFRLLVHHIVPLSRKTSRGSSAAGPRVDAMAAAASAAASAVHYPGQRPAVLLMHGLLMNSEVFVLDKSVSLAAYLFEQGFDVYLGNSRGNKYSWKHRSLPRDGDRYWDFCIDDLAKFDVPALVDCVCRHSKQSSIGYVGFSNGTAQMFAALALGLVPQVSVFVALAPACRIRDLHPDSVALRWLYPLLGSNASFFRAIFGRRAFLSVTLQWQRLLSPQLFTAAILFCLRNLFTWDCVNLREPIRSQLFAHMYSTTSSKTVHQWFRMLRDGKFERYIAEMDHSISVETYAINRIQTEVVLVYGGRDRLSDVAWLREELSGSEVREECIEDFEHLDFLGSTKVSQKLFPVVRAALELKPSSPPANDFDAETVEDSNTY